MRAKTSSVVRIIDHSPQNAHAVLPGGAYLRRRSIALFAAAPALFFP
jgi:hypothetical protein